MKSNYLRLAEAAERSLMEQDGFNSDLDNDNFDPRDPKYQDPEFWQSFASEAEVTEYLKSHNWSALDTDSAYAIIMAISERPEPKQRREEAIKRRDQERQEELNRRHRSATYGYGGVGRGYSVEDWESEPAYIYGH